MDSADPERLAEAKDELDSMLEDDSLRNASLLVFSNKVDMPRSLSTAEVTEKLGLHNHRGRDWYIQATCAVTGEGLVEGLEWLAEKIKNRKSNNVF